MNGKFKLKLLFIIIASLFAVYIIINLIPIKMGIGTNIINTKKANSSKEIVLICKNVQVTGPTWVVIGDAKGLFEENKGEYIWTEGNTPETILDSSISRVSNKYVFTGKFIGNKIIDGETLKVFRVSDWEIAKPINRDSFRMLFAVNSNYLTIFDYKWFDKKK